mmetsp:Transcript_2812/g.8265  ORF Transcript_2812/g.8265 Transcript_2812/m.8265 type:complete len:270 (+) Transcript_2812:917-1726(+)
MRSSVRRGLALPIPLTLTQDLKPPRVLLRRSHRRLYLLRTVPPTACHLWCLWNLFSNRTRTIAAQNQVAIARVSVVEGHILMLLSNFWKRLMPPSRVQNAGCLVFSHLTPMMEPMYVRPQRTTEKFPVPLLHSLEIFSTCGFVMQDMPLEQMQYRPAHQEISRLLESTARIFPFLREKVSQAEFTQQTCHHGKTTSKWRHLSISSVWEALSYMEFELTLLSPSHLQVLGELWLFSTLPRMCRETSAWPARYFSSSRGIGLSLIGALSSM